DGDTFLPLQHFDRADFRKREDVPDWIAVALLDLDHARAQIGEQRGAVRRGVVRAELDDGDPRERWRRVRALRRHPDSRSLAPVSHLAAVLVEARRGAIE